MSLSLRLRAERKQIAETMRSLLNSTSPNAAEQWHKLDEAQEELRKKIEAIETDGIERDLSTTKIDRQRPNPNSGYEDQRSLTPQEEVRSSLEYRKAFETFIRTGKESYETRALSSTGDGETLIPIQFQKELEVKLKSYSGMRQACRIIQTATGANLTWPTVDDTGNTGEILAESAAVHQLDPTFDAVTLGSSLISSKQVIVPIQVVQDSAVNLEQYLSEAFAVRIGRTMEANYTAGTGAITGIMTALVAAGGRSVNAVGANSNSGNAGDTALTSVGTDDLGNLVAALDPAYRVSPYCGFMANSTTWDKLRRQQDRYGRPIWQTSVAAGEPDKVWGFPYFYNQNMEAIGASKKSLLFGDFSKYIIRDSLGISLCIYRELYMPNHQLGFQAFARTDGKLLQPSAFVYLLHPAS